MIVPSTAAAAAGCNGESGNSGWPQEPAPERHQREYRSHEGAPAELDAEVEAGQGAESVRSIESHVGQS
jgi:hypothetical protein